MHLANRFIIVFFVLLSQMANVQAQSVGLYVCTLDYVKDHKTAYLLSNKSKKLEVALSTARILGPYPTMLDAGSDIILRGEKELEDGTVTYPTIAQAKLPNNIKQPIMILVPSSEGLPYKSIIIDRQHKKGPVGSYLLANVSPMEVRGLLGSTNVEASAESVTPISLAPDTEDLFNVHFEYKLPNGWKTFGRTRWTKQKDKQTLLGVYLDPKTKRMKIRGLTLNPLTPH